MRKKFPGRNLKISHHPPFLKRFIISN